MSAPQLSLTHLTRPPREQQPGAPPLLLLLHGVGSHEADLFPLAEELDGRFFVVSARGPNTLRPGAYAWYEVVFAPTGFVIDPRQAEESRQALLRFIDELVAAYGVDPARVYLMGFSQGAIMSLAVALTRPDKVAGVVAMSGRLLPEFRPLIAEPEALVGLPILVVHGLADQVMPIRDGREVRDTLSALPVALTYREHPMGHHVAPESLRDVAAWLRERLDEGRDGVERGA